MSSLAPRLGRLFGLKYVEDLRTLMFTGGYFTLFAILWFSWKWIFVTAATQPAVWLLVIPAWLSLCYLSFIGAGESTMQHINSQTQMYYSAPLDRLAHCAQHSLLQFFLLFHSLACSLCFCLLCVSDHS